MLTLHNVTFYQTLMAGARAAIERGAFDEYHRAVTERYRERAGSEAAPDKARPAPKPSGDPE
jgi:queuine/archaeosine tRNA-ribosyltransferase